ncbi:MAG: DUF4178 domain-containing protein [Desulfomonilaceae bacterium]
MEREFQCPSCGASNTVTNPGVLMRVCGYCKTAIYWDKESVLRAGEKSMDLPDSPRFKVGATGKIKGRSFRVLGRIHYAHEKGTWNEWFVEMENGEIMWLTEDERELFLESPMKLTSPVPPHSELKPGMRIKLNEKEGVIEEIGEAKCLGGEGEIPFQVEIGKVYPYADGSTPDGASSFGLEYDPATGNVTAFFGRIIDFKEGKPAPEAQKTGVSKVGEVIRCGSCGKPYEGPRVETTGMVVCPACGAGLQLDEAEIRVVGRNKGNQPKFTLNIGAPVTLENTRYEIMGRLYYVEMEEKVQYSSMEYVLYNPDSGYLWLSEENGHFTLSRTIHTRIPIPPIPVAKMQVRVGNESFKIYESGELTLQWVDGALPWVAVVGEKTRYTHMIKPPDYVDQEITGNEVEQFRGRYIGRDEMQAAVGESVELPQAKGVYSCQPYVPSAWVAGTWIIGAAFVALNILLLFYAFSSDKDTPLMQENITAEQYSQEHMTKPFTVSRNGTILCLQGQAPVKNSWLAADFALVDAEDRVISEFDGEASYYHGQDSEGTWTEGSSSFNSCFRVEKAGSYRLLVYGQGGSDYSGPSKREPLKIRVYADKTISWYFIIPLLLSALVMIIGPFKRMAFEARRWRTVTGDSDDDGNGGDDD